MSARKPPPTAMVALARKVQANLAMPEERADFWNMIAEVAYQELSLAGHPPAECKALSEEALALILREIVADEVEFSAD